jgi:predicted RNA binding protein YcfA (HicA-like mRNA interferase family)
MTFRELIRKLESVGFRLDHEKGSERFYAQPGTQRVIRVDYYGGKEVPSGTCHAILKAAGLKTSKND